MALPTITTRIAFLSDPMDDPPTWSDVSSDIWEFHIRRGRNHELDRMEAGRATIILNNSSGDYWPDNAGGTYYPNVFPAKAINLRATYDSTTYDLFFGFIESWVHGFRGDGDGMPIVTITAVDLLKNFSRYFLNTSFSEELASARVTNIMSALGWGTYNIDTAQSTMIASGTLDNVSSLSHLYTVMESEHGLLYVGPDGALEFRERHHRLKTPYYTSQATFGDDAGEMPYHKLEFSHDDTHIYNNIQITRSGGTEQTAEDSTSQTAYGERMLARTGLFMTTDAEALAQAQFLLSRWKDATLRVKSITINPAKDEANLYPKILTYDIGTRITVRLNSASLDREYHIEGIQHDAQRNHTWRTTWQLSDADSQTYLILDHATHGKLDTGRLAY